MRAPFWRGPEHGLGAGNARGGAEGVERGRGSRFGSLEGRGKRVGAQPLGDTGPGGERGEGGVGDLLWESGEGGAEPFGGAGLLEVAGCGDGTAFLIILENGGAFLEASLDLGALFEVRSQSKALLAGASV